ncbi:hypothetical protein WL285_13255, partial [Staphylococcus warneri]
LKEIQNNINETEKSNKISKKALSEAEQQIHRIEKDLTKSKKQQSEYEDKLYQAYRYNEKLKSRIDSLATQEEDYTYFFNG